MGGVLCFLYFYLSSFTMMNMVVGMMCEVIAGVAKEREEVATYEIPMGKLQEVYHEIDTNCDGCISQDELEAILDHEETLALLERIGIDVYALIDDIDSIYVGLGREGLPFDSFVDVLWQYRPTNESTIRCVSAFRSLVFAKLCDMEDKINRLDFRMTANCAAKIPCSVNRRCAVALSDKK